jgi:hypothetical protein
MLVPLKEKKFVPTLSGFGRIVNLNCSLLSPPIKTNEKIKNLEAMIRATKAQLPK